MKFTKILVHMIIVFTLLGCGTAKPQSTTPTNTQNQPPQAQTSTSQVQLASTNPTKLTTVLFRWIGVDVDNLSPNDLKLDGNLDGHFHITVPVNQPSAIKSIWIRYSEFGKSLKWGWFIIKILQ